MNEYFSPLKELKYVLTFFETGLGVVYCPVSPTGVGNSFSNGTILLTGSLRAILLKMENHKDSGSENADVYKLHIFTIFIMITLHVCKLIQLTKFR